MQNLRIIELFAGVGGFRVGLERVDKDFFKTVWANQWEPATKTQHAAMVYEARFGEGSICNLDINTVKTEDIPDHDMLVGGYPVTYSAEETGTSELSINHLQLWIIPSDFRSVAVPNPRHLILIISNSYENAKTKRLRFGYRICKLSKNFRMS